MMNGSVKSSSWSRQRFGCIFGIDHTDPWAVANPEPVKVRFDSIGSLITIQIGLASFPEFLVQDRKDLKEFWRCAGYRFALLHRAVISQRPNDEGGCSVGLEC